MKNLKNILVAFLVIALAITTFTSCEKEGAGYFNPDQKISKIFMEEEGEIAYLKQAWTWEDNLLTKITYYNLGQEEGFETYSYEDKRLIKVLDNYGYYSTFTYHEQHFSKIEYFNNVGTLLTTVEFTYTDEKVTNIKMTSTGVTKHLTTMWTRGLIGKILPTAAMEQVIKSSVSEDNQSKSEVNVSIVYNGDNVASYVIGDYSYTFSEYDDKMNPLFAFAPYSTYDEDTAMDVFSVNNPGKMVTTYLSIPVTTDYNYTYEGEYPTVIESVTSLGLATLSKKMTIEYK